MFQVILGHGAKEEEVIILSSQTALGTTWSMVAQAHGAN